MPKGAAKRAANLSEKSVLADIDAELNRSFDEVLDLPLLRRLWVAAQGDDSVAFERRGEARTQFGFQQEDPISDLRGGGVLGLRLRIRWRHAEATCNSPRPGRGAASMICIFSYNCYNC